MERQTKNKTMSEDTKALANRIRFPDKERDLCQAVGMASDLPVLLRKAIEAYESEDLKPDGIRCMRNAVLFLGAYEKLERQYANALEEMAEMSGLNILEIGYD